MASNRSVSRALRLEVGSSRIRIRALALSALAISTSCRWAIGKLPQSVDGSRSSPTRSSHRAASACIERVLSQPKRWCSRPSRIAPARSRFSARLSSWCTSAMPACAASATLRSRRSRAWPCASISSSEPELGASTPDRILSSVLLPAPFSPTMASTSPALMSASMPSSAVTPAKRRPMPRARRIDRTVGSLGMDGLYPRVGAIGLDGATSARQAPGLPLGHFAALPAASFAFRSDQNASTLSLVIVRAGMFITPSLGIASSLPWVSACSSLMLS